MRSRWLLAALLVGLIARLAFEVQLAPYPRQERMLNILDDQGFFVDWAAAMAHGEAIDLTTSPHEWAYWAARHPELPPQAPLYPAILALLSLVVGSAPVWIRASQVVAGLATIVAVFLVTRRRFGEPEAVLAAFGAALYAPWIFFEATVLRTSWLVLFFVALVAGLDALTPIDSSAGRMQRRTALAVGAFLGLAVLLQEQFLLLAVAGLIWLARRRRAGARWLVLGCTAVLLPLIGWASLHAGRPVLSTASTPFNLLIANLHDASPQLSASTPTYAEIKVAGVHGPVRALASDLKTHPAEFADLVLRKIGFLLRPVEIPNNVNYYLGRHENPTLRWTPFDYPTLLPLALAGLLLARRRARPAAPLLTLAALYAATLVAFVPLARLRQPLALVLLVFAGAGAVELCRRFRARPALALLALVALIAVGVGIRPDPRRQIRSTDWQMAGGAWENEARFHLARGRLPEARAALLQALLRNPGASSARAALPDLDARIGAAPVTPLPAEIASLCDQGTRLAQSGDLPSARRLLERATRQAPGHPRPWHLLANVHFLRQDPRAAELALERAILADPYDAVLLNNLALLRGLHS